MADKPAGNDGADASQRANLRRAWRVASQIVNRRPWLDVSWVRLDEDFEHLVVHDGPHGAALHFDDDDGPTWAPRTSPETPLDWDETLGVNDADVTGPVDWSEQWGPAAEEQLSGKTITYSLITQLLDSDDSVAARPAKILHPTDESADAPDSAFTLIDSFATLGPTVQWYVSQLSSASWGEGAVWHEPLWLITRNQQPILVLDEAGHAHFTVTTIHDVLSVMASTVDLGGIPDPDGFDLVDAIERLNGDVGKLATHILQGPGAVLRAVKPQQQPCPPASDGEEPLGVNDIDWPELLREIHGRLDGAAEGWEAGGGHSFIPLGRHGVDPSLWYPDLTRYLFEQGRNEDALKLVSPVIEMGVPWWLLQIRKTAAGRLHSALGQREEAVECLVSALQIPLYGMADADYVLRALWDMTMLDQMIPPAESSAGEPPAWVWAQVTMWFARRINGLKQGWYGPAQDDQLHQLVTAGQGDPDWRWIPAHYPAHQPLPPLSPPDPSILPASFESRVRGLMLGLALGDAIGSCGDEVPEQGPLASGVATQLAAWTVEGTLRQITRYGSLQPHLTDNVRDAYKRWAALRNHATSPTTPPAPGHRGKHHRGRGWLIDEPAMANLRGRSPSTEKALIAGRPVRSRGCQALLRVLPLAALAFLRLEGSSVKSQDAQTAAETYARSVAALTHDDGDHHNVTVLAVRILWNCLATAHPIGSQQATMKALCNPTDQNDAVGPAL